MTAPATIAPPLKMLGPTTLPTTGQVAPLDEGRGSVAQVGVNVLGGARLIAAQQRAGVGEHHRVVVRTVH